MFPGSAVTGGRETEGVFDAPVPADGLPQAASRPVPASPALPASSVRRLTYRGLTVASRSRWTGLFGRLWHRTSATLQFS